MPFNYMPLTSCLFTDMPFNNLPLIYRMVKWKNFNIELGEIIMATSMTHWLDAHDKFDQTYYAYFNQTIPEKVTEKQNNFDLARNLKLNPIKFVEEMITRKINKGIFEVPHVTSCYLVKTSLIQTIEWNENYNAVLEDIWFSNEMKKRKITPKILNKKTYGSSN